MSCGQVTTIIKFRLGPEKWNFVHVHKLITRNVDEAIKTMIDRNDHRVYWGGRLNDLFVVSKFRENNQIAVEVFDSLNKKQYDAIKILQKEYTY